MMEFHFSSFSIILQSPIIIIILISLILKLGRKRFKTNGRASSNNLPPGPWKLPILGSIHHLIGDLPHRRLTKLSKKHGPIIHMQLGETPAIVISSPEIAKELFKTHDTAFAQRPQFPAIEALTYGWTDLAFSPYGNFWKQVRKICTVELLSAKRVRSFKFIRMEEVSSLVRSVSMNVGSSINLTEMFLNMSYSIIARATFGKKTKDQDAYVSIIKETLTSSSLAFGVSNLFPSQKWLHVISGVERKVKEMHRTCDRVLDDIIDEATSKIDGDGDGTLLGILLKLKENGACEFQLTNDNIKAILQDMLIAGGETTSLTVEWIFSEMLKNPRVLKKAQAEVRKVFGNKDFVDEMGLEELKFLKAVIKESMRLHPPTPVLLPKECLKCCEINGYTIPVGTQVFVNVWAIGRDPKYWSEAERFYPERFLDSEIDYKGSHFEFIPFGAGKRMCPGISFAEPNIELPLAQLLYYFDWELPWGISHENFDMTEDLGSTMRRKNELFVIPIVHHNVPLE
ncbi:desmethyl-deoxy-podophyllotoxin synthase [Arachis hypogaea]|uniref:desmethyl-deoxy-podophyllotoxin synthase n=1 Tax=Arachis hypogaea TaxID=3818 RepID=UPI000DEC370E|nr:premnaspirodiene oxygenase [Arachis hypogaea]